LNSKIAEYESFVMLSLPNITLVAASSVDLEATELALRISSHHIQFGAIKFLCSEPFNVSDPKIKIESIPRMDLVGYSKFILNDLHRYVDTDYCLVVQSDGFVLNANFWDSSFLSYDYIGAPWPQKLFLQPGNIELDMHKNCIGNGGFSLRSKKLLLETAKIDFSSLTFPTKSEDLIICHYLYDHFIDIGIRFPDPEIAARFSIESQDALYGQNAMTTFGFHGKWLRDAIFQSMRSPA
jgi:hypothetical protein